MRRFRLVAEYDGTDFAGFQVQAPGLRTVQGELEAAIKRLAGEARVHGAGRTDAGVHAAGQVVHFDTDWSVPVGRIAYALNGELPRDVVVTDAQVVDATFHARFSATARTYRYTIWRGEHRSPLCDRLAWHVRTPLDETAMRAAARELTGTHDYGAFGQPDEVGKSTVRHMFEWTFDGAADFSHITVRGNAFLRSQVRAFVGTLAQVGLAKLSVRDVVRIRESRDRTQCPSIAPARGLTLWRVHYDGTRMTGANGEPADPHAM